MRCIALLFALLLTACSTVVEVTGHIPQPLSQPLPFHGALVLEEKLRNSAYRTTSGHKVEVSIGAAQAQMFTTIVPHLFSTLLVSADFEATLNTQAELILLPELREIQVATPNDTQLKIYEVWLRYLIHIYDNAGREIVRWPLAAYGKTQSQFMKSDEDALNQAAIVALRDAGARIALEFEREPLVQRWIQQRLHSRSMTASAVTANSVRASTEMESTEIESPETASTRMESADAEQREAQR